MAQVRSDRNKLTLEGRKKAKEFLQQGELVVEQFDTYLKPRKPEKRQSKVPKVEN